ncbi:FAD-linked oxidase C-terminal domain-containing protein [Hymenobacter sp. ASUV-10]|uniref:FAD-linked oxidase C-terminal domain-containing protein n=1 Tax=Hymenobacter aranciens TaxID=3063996 RepID=A0ABT9BC57_9BACT|nr:FAD-linked oxidase C-terminal domain-containing protein [Hymenobacter sp. ASUV-10]MDO7874138.1 FAD-linked oxidase C-terminal domain-containing protein [Hymenobacter sp. ASUV-10]
MAFNQLTPELVVAFEGVVGPANVLTAQRVETDVYADYGRDHTEDLEFAPDVVLRPGTAEEVAAIMGLCHAAGVPVTARGAGTGLSGGALPIHHGVVLSTERLNRILQIDERNLQATVEPGVINEVFQNAVKEVGLFYPPDPASKGSCTLGGNLAHSSGGPRAVKYGTTKDYVLNLQVALPTGELIWTAANTLKNSTGYNLTQLMVGSEGTLGIITKVVFRLLPYPQQNVLMLVPFRQEAQAAEAVSAVFRAGIIPSAMEFMEREAIAWSSNYLNIPLTLPEEIRAHLLIELDGQDLDQLYKEAEQVYAVLENYDVDEILLADTAAQKDDLWKIRRNIGNSVRYNSVYKEEDTVVPRAELPTLLKGVKEIGARYGFKSVCYGHAGDGNLHVNIIRGELTDEQWNVGLRQPISEIFELCVQLGGTISGEHGIGLVQKPYIGIALKEANLNLMRGIKAVFDPKGILNPGKIF